MSEEAAGRGGAPLRSWHFARVDSASMKEWVEVLRDENAIHVDPAAAAAKGYGNRTVNPGPANLAYVLNMLMQACPTGYPAAIEARFLDNVLSDDAVEVTGTRAADGTCLATLRVVGSERPALEVSATLSPVAER